MDISDSLQDQRDAHAAAQALSVCQVWPEHWQALSLFLACRRQIEITLGGMGGVHHMPARSVNVSEELRWLNLPKKVHASTVALYRDIEQEMLLVLNARANQAT
jgi:hypothetical protein